MNLKKVESVLLKKVESVLGPAQDWAGQCYAIACAMVNKKLVKGVARYGHWLGFVAPGTLFYGRPVVRHGWVEVAGKKIVEIVDPTRWVFEGCSPYIYQGKNDFYDLGGNVYREKNMMPPPEPDEKIYNLALSAGSRKYFLDLLGHDRFTNAGLFWLGNLPLGMLGSRAKELYTALKRAGRSAVVPLDNFDFVMGRNA